MSTKLFERSLLLRLGIAMAAIALLTVLGMASSIIVAETMQGSGAAIDLAGSLRMQSHRIVNLVLLAQERQNPDDKRAAQAALQRFDSTLRDGRLLSALPTDPGSAPQIHYRALVNDWQQHLQPAVLATLEGTGRGGATAGRTYAGDVALLGEIDGFVEHVGPVRKAAEPEHGCQSHPSAHHPRRLPVFHDSGHLCQYVHAEYRGARSVAGSTRLRRANGARAI